MWEQYWPTDAVVSLRYRGRPDPLLLPTGRMSDKVGLSLRTFVANLAADLG